jgi:hypothetical protein
MIAEMPDRAVPLQVKHRDAEIAGNKPKGRRHVLEQGNGITQRAEDCGPLKLTSAGRGRECERLTGQAMAIPAPLACY